MLSASRGGNEEIAITDNRVDSNHPAFVNKKAQMILVEGTDANYQCGRDSHPYVRVSALGTPNPKGI